MCDAIRWFKCKLKPPKKPDNKKHDVKNTSDGNGEKRRDVNNDSDEDLVIKRSKTSVVSVRRSAHQQQNKNEIQNKLSKLKNQQSKKLAAPFILDKSDVTFRPPHALYGDFGMKETLNEDQSKTCNAAYEEEEEDPGETSSSLEAIVVTKPKQGFLDNELFSDDNMDISDDTLRNNINSIANLKEEDIEIYEIINDSSNGNKTDKKEDKDRSGNRDVNNSEVFNRSGKRDVNNSEESDVTSEDPDAYRIDNTPGFLDCRWRIQNNVYPVDNRGFGHHKKTLEEMENTGNKRDQELLQVLSDVTSTVNRQACEEDESRQDCEEDDEEGDSDNECETCGYNSQDYSDSGNDGDGTPTSEYESAKDEITNRSHNSDTRDKSDVQKEGDGATVPDKKECDITDNDGGGKREVDEAL